MGTPISTIDMQERTQGRAEANKARAKCAIKAEENDALKNRVYMSDARNKDKPASAFVDQLLWARFEESVVRNQGIGDIEDEAIVVLISSTDAAMLVLSSADIWNDMKAAHVTEKIDDMAKRFEMTQPDESETTAFVFCRKADAEKTKLCIMSIILLPIMDLMDLILCKSVVDTFQDVGLSEKPWITVQRGKGKKIKVLNCGKVSDLRS